MARFNYLERLTAMMEKHQMRETSNNRLIASMLVSIDTTKDAKGKDDNYILSSFTDKDFENLEAFLTSFQE